MDVTIEEFLRKATKKLEKEQRGLDAKLADLQAKNRELDARRARLNLNLPEPESCPRCFYDHGRICELTAERSAPRADLVRCASCGYERQFKR